MPTNLAEAVPSVAVEIADGDEIGTTQIAREKHLDIATVFRWIDRGLPAADGSRVRLEAVKRGKSWWTSRAALRRFFSALPTNHVSANQAARRPTTRSAAQRERDDNAARQQLKATHGI